MPEEPDGYPTLVVLRDTSFDGRIPPELGADLALDAAHILRTGSIGFTAALTRAQRILAQHHRLVDRIEPDPDHLAPFIGITPDPQAPDRFTAMLTAGDPLDVARAIGLGASEVAVTGLWLTARLTSEQVLALRRDPRVDFVDYAIMDQPA